MENALQKYLRNTMNPVEAIYREKGVNVNRHPDYPNLVLFKYGMITADWNDPVTCSCRGHILDENNNWEFVCHPFEKFHNIESGHANPIDWGGSAVVAEKLDGSLCNLYWYDGDWRVSTTGTANAGGNVHGTDQTFAELFFATLDAQHPYWREWVEPWQDCTFMFELTSQHNRIVVQHNDPKVSLLAIRRNTTGEYLGTMLFSRFELVKTYSLTSLHETFSALHDIDGGQREGFVVSDAFGHMVKIKHPRYVLIHHLKSKTTDKNLVRAIMAGETEELIEFFPELENRINVFALKIEKFKNEIALGYIEASKAVDQKQFAYVANQMTVPSALFAWRKVSDFDLHEWLSDSRREELLMNNLNIKEDSFPTP